MSKNNRAGVRQTFCKRHFSCFEQNVQWLDVVGLVQMKKDRVAKIELSDPRVKDNYDTLTVTIVHKMNGKIDQKSFRLNDYLDERADTRKDTDTNFYVWADRGSFDWYICVPTEEALKHLMYAVSVYIDTYEV